MAKDDLARQDGEKLGGTAAPEGRARRLKELAVEEAKRFIVLFVYLWILFGLFVLNQRIILHQHGINFTAQGFAIINALVLAKVMLVLENFNLGRWLHGRPLIYPIVFEAALFTVLFILFHILEEIVVGWSRSETVSDSIPAIGGGGLAGLLCVALLLFFALLPFTAFKNLDRALGPGRLKALLFSRGAA